MIEGIIAGLGNPGKEYENTRHNCGFMTIDFIAREFGAKAFKGKFRGAVTDCVIGGKNVLLLKPMTYMNISGDSVAECLRFYNLGADSLIVIYDDCDLPVGRLRVRGEGGAGGHNGVKSVIGRLGTQVFNRVRVGIGEKPERMDLADYVTSRFTKAEREEIDIIVPKAAAAAECLLKNGLEAAMNAFNG